MSIQSYIAKTREKPELERRALVFTWAFIGTIIIAFIWLVNFSVTMQSQDQEDARLRAQAAQAAKEGSSTPAVHPSFSVSASQMITDNVKTIEDGWDVIISKIK